MKSIRCTANGGHRDHKGLVGGLPQEMEKEV
jgi:hypothetical protein